MCVHACVWFFRLAYPIPPGSLLSHGGGTHTFTWAHVPWGLSLSGGLNPNTRLKFTQTGK